MDDAVAVTIIQRTCNLSTELPGLFLFELPMRDDVVEHLATIDEFEEHIPVVIGTNDVPKPAYVRMVQ